MDVCTCMNRSCAISTIPRLCKRAECTIVNLICKVLEMSSDWSSDLGLLLYHYQIRSHHTTKLSPMMAVVGWQPNHLIVEGEQSASSLSQWSEHLQHSAKIRDMVKEQLSTADFLDIEKPCAYSVGSVLLRHPGRQQKHKPPFELGWRAEVISLSTVIVSKFVQCNKVVIVDLIKSDPSPDIPDTPVELDVLPDDYGDVIYL